MFQVVVENLLTGMPPTTKSASLGFITWQAKYRHTNYHEVSVISKLKGSHEHSLAAYTYQTVKRDGVVVLILTSLQTSNQSSGNARRQSANWKLLIWGGRLSVWICLETRGLQKQHPVHSACCIPASGRYERDILDHARLVCTFSQPLQMLSPKALCKCMHECFTEALTRGCRLHQEPLDLLQAETLRHKLHRLERVIFVRSLLNLHSCCKRALCSSLCGFQALALQVDSKWFQTITKLIRRDAFSANISLPSFHKNWSLIGREMLHCWYWKNRTMAMSVKFCIEVHWLRQVSGPGSLFASSLSKTGSLGVRLCLETFRCQSLLDCPEGWGKSHAAVVGATLGKSLWKRQVFGRTQRAFACVLPCNASSGLPEEPLVFEHLFHFHDVSMHLGGLNPLMRRHEQRKVRNLTARFKARTPLRLPYLHTPRRSVYQEGAVAASNSHWWKEHRRIHTKLAGIPSV